MKRAWYHHLMPSAEDTILKSRATTRRRGRRNLTRSPITSARQRSRKSCSAPLARLLPRTADPDMASIIWSGCSPNRKPAHLPHCSKVARELDATLQLLATSQFFADTLAAYPEFLTGRVPAPRRSPSTAELTTATAERSRSEQAMTTGVLRAFRRFRDRHTLRIGISDVDSATAPLEEITRELARLADASIEAAASALRCEQFGAGSAFR